MARRPGFLTHRWALLVAALSLACTSRPSPSRVDGPTDAGDDADGDADTGSPDADDADADATVAPGGYELVSFPGGFDDAFALPPAFAPFFPLSGAEATREPPGMYDAASAELFSYVVLWWLSGVPELTTSALHDDIFVYYTGLCGGATVSLDDPVAPGANDAGTGLSRVGSLDVNYCLGLVIPALVRLEVSTYDCPDHDAVLMLVSPEPEASEVWTELRRVGASFRCW